MKDGILTYPEAARIIALYLKDFCDEKKNYSNMIADASRKAKQTIDNLNEDKNRMCNDVENVLAELTDNENTYHDLIHFLNNWKTS